MLIAARNGRCTHCTQFVRGNVLNALTDSLLNLTQLSWVLHYYDPTIQTQLQSKAASDQHIMLTKQQYTHQGQKQH